ncbi:MAG: endonuclease/exonuclease/phosphatase family protein [Candidatus Latescibacterota bacterium]|jgi:endonuclease/exonuclease/phosphatase family metal-dependent hydrolase|tara:strand:- start:279 stop:1313 length:1035 start_codon:yes stop_codon:yes gene_type:complete
MKYFIIHSFTLGLLLDFTGCLSADRRTNQIPVAPVAPSGIELKVLADTLISVSWTDNSENEAGFNVYWTEESAKENDALAISNAPVDANIIRFDITALKADTEYVIWVTAYDNKLESESISATATTNEKPVFTIKAMSLNIYGWATMPQKAATYAQLIKSRNPDVVGIQEGVDDWKINSKMPTNYRNADALGSALGECWDQNYQIFINTCKGNSYISNRRFDLTDGPNATRTGESAVINNKGMHYAAINVHWDHESGGVRVANAHETATEVNSHPDMPVVVVGDFNANCTGFEVRTMMDEAGLTLIGSAGIDCIIARSFTGISERFSGAPSDHPSLDAELTIGI